MAKSDENTKKALRYLLTTNQRMIRRLLYSYVEAQGTVASQAKRTVRKRAPI
jgi:hypothetical protein